MPLRENATLDAMTPRRKRALLLDPQRILLRRAALLEPKDRMVVELAMKNHASHRQLGLILGIPAGTVTRRLRRLTNRLHDPFVLTLIEPPVELADELRQIGLEFFLQGRSVARLSELHQLPPAQVRRMIEAVRAWYRQIVRPETW